jgi:cytochrome P450
MSLPRLGYDPCEGRDAGSPPIEWIPALGFWCVFETGTITAILKSTDFVVADLAQWHRMLAKLGIDCSAMIEILDHVATANEGQRHTEIRKTMARCIAAQTSSTKDTVTETISALVPARCRDGQRVDLVREIIRPACDTLFERLLGVPVPSNEGISASQIFDSHFSLNRRKQIVSKAAAMFETYTEAQDRLNVAPGYAAALRMLGYDSIVGSLGGSILHVLEGAPGKRLCEITYPAKLPRTGVPYIERFAAADRQVGNAAIKQGNRIRLYLESGSQGDNARNGECHFGRGRHSCLGEDLSSWMWRALTAEFAQLPLRFTVESAIRRKPDWFFAYYSNIVVDFHA